MPHGQEALDIVRRLISASTEGRVSGEMIAEDQNLYEFGIDSLATVSLLVALAEETDIDLEQFIDDMDTPRSVSDIVSIAKKFLMTNTLGV